LRRGTHTATILVRAHINEAGFHPQIVRVNRNILLFRFIRRIRNRRTQSFGNRVSRAFIGKFQDVQRLRNIAPANQINDQSRFPRRAFQMSCFCYRFHFFICSFIHLFIESFKNE